MFRAAVSEIDASEGWVKCGRCRKVFDCRENEIKPSDFLMPEKEIDDETVSKNSGPEEKGENTQAHEDGLVPQIPLFDDSELPQNIDAGTWGDAHDNASAELDSATQDRSGSAGTTDETAGDRSVPLTPSPDRADMGRNPGLASLSIEDNHLRKSAAQNQKLQSHRRNVDVGGASQGKTRHKNRYPSILKNRLNISKPQAPRFSRVILAKAQSWKKQKSHSRKAGILPYVLVSVVLFTLLVWQISVVSYTRLSQYGFLSAPLAGVCAIITCNQADEPRGRGFEILHASIRRHAWVPNAMTVSANLINFSDENRLIPRIRLDLTGDANTVISSQIIDLAENPQYVDPAMTELAPGQDVRLKFDIANPGKLAHGFQLNFVTGQYQ